METLKWVSAGNGKPWAVPSFGSWIGRRHCETPYITCIMSQRIALPWGAGRRAFLVPVPFDVDSLFWVRRFHPVWGRSHKPTHFLLLFEFQHAVEWYACWTAIYTFWLMKGFVTAQWVITAF